MKISQIKFFLYKKIEKSFTNKEKLKLGKNDTFLSLQRLFDYNYNPSYVIDVGAYVGEWTLKTCKIFPLATFIAVEALPDKKFVLEKTFKNIPVKIYNNLVGDSNKKNVPFYAMETGSSVLEEQTDFERTLVNLDMITLNEIARNEKIQGNILLKLDVQGFELEVLKGATEILDKIEVVCMEMSFLNYIKDAPLADEVIITMKELGFVIYDITGFMRKSTDNALMQSDFIFIKSDSLIRQKINNFKGKFSVISS